MEFSNALIKVEPDLDIENDHCNEVKPLIVSNRN